ncbi:hypothetical protein ILFOPFJJ_03052 [Ensifer psoraleae]|nr:hypothetical protein [Sinorhizobium psoraleae]
MGWRTEVRQPFGSGLVRAFVFDFDGILNGFYLALTMQNLGLAFLGCLLGTLVCILPGVGPLATVSMFLSMTIFLDPLTALVMLAGIYYGAQYGGSTNLLLVFSSLAMHAEVPRIARTFPLLMGSQGDIQPGPIKRTSLALR